MRRLVILAVLPMLLTACQQAAEAPEGEAVAAETAAPAEDATLDLQATGIVIPAQGGAGQLDIPFGSGRAAAEASIGSVAGAVERRGENGECGAGPMQITEYDALVLHFQQDKLVGWSASAPYVPQLTRAEMLADPAVALLEGSTLGEEFTIGTEGGPVISGLFTGADDNAAVETLWSGASCVFR